VIEKTIKALTNVHIELDKTTRENKNKFVISFSAWIVDIGLAKNIRVGVCHVGYA